MSTDGRYATYAIWKAEHIVIHCPSDVVGTKDAKSFLERKSLPLPPKPELRHRPTHLFPFLFPAIITKHDPSLSDLLAISSFQPYDEVSRPMDTLYFFYLYSWGKKFPADVEIGHR